MTNENKIEEAASTLQQSIAYASPKEEKCILALNISDTKTAEIQVKKLLSADEMVSFADGVTDALFLNDRYTPALYPLVYAKAVIAYYTNLNASISNEDIVGLAFNTDIISKITEAVNHAQRDEIICAIAKSVEYRVQEILNTQSTRLEKAIQEIEILTETMSKFAELFDGIDVKQVAESSIKLANMSEHNLINNILEVKLGEEASAEGIETGDENV